MARGVCLNRRLAALLTVAALLATAPASWATWRCPDGKLCPLGCPGTVSRSAQQASAPSIERPVCPLCTARQSAAGRRSSASLRRGVCVLSVGSAPVAVLAHHLTAPDVAALPIAIPIAVLDVPTAPPATRSVATDPSPPLRDHDGRAPPTLS